LAAIEVTEERTETRGKKKVISCNKKIKMSDRKSALDSICKVLGFNAPEKQQHDLGNSFLDFLKQTSAGG